MAIGGAQAAVAAAKGPLEMKMATVGCEKYVQAFKAEKKGKVASRKLDRLERRADRAKANGNTALADRLEGKIDKVSFKTYCEGTSKKKPKKSIFDLDDPATKSNCCAHLQTIVTNQKIGIGAAEAALTARRS